MPARARLVVGGYLVTKDVTIILDSIDDVVTIEYDRGTRRVAAVDGYAGPIIVRWHDR